MKLRIRGDTLRLRLSQSEVASLGASGRVEDAIHFGPAPAELAYAIVSDPSARILRAELAGTTIVVHVPAEDVRAWVDTDRVGLDGEQALEGGRVLAILIEKDFKCLVPRPGEEDQDGFPNPAASC